VELRDLAYGLYSRKLRRELSGVTLPTHVGLIMDGNRRWARQMGMASPSLGHKYGAEHVEDVLNWCERAGIRNVTVFVCSAENLQRRGDAEIAFLMLWQAVHSELYFCDAYWPAFREIDFLRALRSYAARQSQRGA